MVVPSRKSRMIQNIMKNQEREKEKLNKKTESKEITPEEHKKRLKKLRDLGLIKKD